MSLLAVVAAYLVGAVPVGWLVARGLGVEDIRRHGSGNIGATNVLRTVGRLPAVLTLLADVAKGYAAVALAAGLAPAPGVVAAAAVAAVAGNCWSVFLGFRGGKGVATGLGALLGLAPWATVAAVPVFLVVAGTTRFVSLGSVLGAVCVPAGALVLGNGPAAVAGAAAVAAIVVARHQENIVRLLAGTERRLGERAGPAAPERGR